MTRFARAKGSKASNERAPEDGTPWEVMKEQLLQAKKENEDAKKRQEAENQRIENYENFLKERKVEKRPATWCDFPETTQKSGKKEQTTPNTDNSTQKKRKKKNNSDALSGEITAQETNSSDISGIKKKKKKKNQNGLNSVSSCDDSSKINENTVQNSEIPKKKKNKQKPQSQDSHEQVDPPHSLNEKPKKKKNKKQKVTDTSTSDAINKSKNEENQNGEVNVQDNDNNKITSAGAKKFNGESMSKNSKAQKSLTKKNKLIDGKPQRRKEINDNSFQIIINGKEVELVRFDGFPIMKKDAERLTELKNSMVKKGIPKTEVQRTMKLERRRAEKALARVKRDVCYNCRKGGHNLSDCPELKSKIPGVGAADGVCFKCGSTEHRQFECKVQRDKEFRFASCFICKEQGHIARQCPDNPKGLYPNGGACKLCGDVTHLRKDCPTVNNTKEETSMKLQTLDSTDNLEDIGHQNKPMVSEELSKKPKKIKF